LFWPFCCWQTELNYIMRGGARTGAGRKRGSTKVAANFKLERTILARLRDRVPCGEMTRFVEQALTRALDELDAD
jgi:hypothetical protein